MLSLACGESIAALVTRGGQVYLQRTEMQHANSASQGPGVPKPPDAGLVTRPTTSRLCLPPPKRAKMPDGSAACGMPSLASGWRLMPALPRRAKAVSCGRGHCLLLVEGGTVFSCGHGAHGQLGHGDPDNAKHPAAVEALEGIVVTQVAAGGWHSIACTADGDVYTFGRNNHGQLGRSAPNLLRLPAPDLTYMRRRPTAPRV